MTQVASGVLTAPEVAAPGPNSMVEAGEPTLGSVRTHSYVNGTPVIQYPYCGAGYAAAEWRRGWVSVPPRCSGNICRSTGAQYPVLINRATNRCLDARNGAGGAPPAQAVLQQWDCIHWATDWNAGNQLSDVWLGPEAIRPRVRH